MMAILVFIAVFGIFSDMNKLINLGPFREFLKSGSAGGTILLFCVVISLVIANSPLGVYFEDFLASEWGIHFTPLGMGIILGLVIGKPLGIALVSWVAVRLRLCTLPDEASWPQIVGVRLLAGIGFTMSIFIALLSFTGQELLMAEAKFSVLVASLLSGVAGASVLSVVSRKKVKPLPRGNT